MNKYHLNRQELQQFSSSYIIFDTHVFSTMVEDADFCDELQQLFPKGTFIIDPIVRLELLRGAYTKEHYSKKINILQYERFHDIVEHQEMFIKSNYFAYRIGLILAHEGYPSVPLGDLFIMARLAAFPKMYLFTKDKDFSSILFDHSLVISVERKSRMEHYSLLKFNQVKFDSCIKTVPIYDSLKIDK